MSYRCRHSFVDSSTCHLAHRENHEIPWSDIASLATQSCTLRLLDHPPAPKPMRSTVEHLAFRLCCSLWFADLSNSPRHETHATTEAPVSNPRGAKMDFLRALTERVRFPTYRENHEEFAAQFGFPCSSVKPRSPARGHHLEGVGPSLQNAAHGLNPRQHSTFGRMW